jgi:hypothetical protein
VRRGNAMVSIGDGHVRTIQGPAPPCQVQSTGGHSGQVSPDTIQHLGDRDSRCLPGDAGGRSCLAMSKARSRACGSARSYIQPCSSHSRMAPASCSTEIAQPCSVLTAVRLSSRISIDHSCLNRILRVRPPFRPVSTGQGFRNVGSAVFSTCSMARATFHLGAQTGKVSQSSERSTK